ncbi:hypothetical protein FSP39_007482 [Pinctada imbricata]|uniref:Uncharacterized protein n=1 Tax=Pinctada imbricata TaxID=66713 RepID=A0AA89C3F2_PINIB|nr:hypothetical protein FSP39_007482 [Pinctada imbricata]
MGSVVESVIEKCASKKANIEEIKDTISKMEESPTVPLNYTEQIRKLQDSLLDLRCRSMKYNLVFTGLPSPPNENCEENLHGFLQHELGMTFRPEIGNVHRFGKPGLGGVRPVVARFLHRNDMEWILKNAYKLKGKPFGINEQFPFVSIQTKIKLFNSLVMSVLTYGSETWKTIEKDKKKLDTFQNRCLRQLLRVRWPDKI